MEHQLRPRKHACRAASPLAFFLLVPARLQGNMRAPGADPDSSVSFPGHGGTTQPGNARSHGRQDW